MNVHNDPNAAAPLAPSAVGRTDAAARSPRSADAGTTGAAATGPAATVEVSSRSRELHEALRAAKAAPDVREAVVRDVRERLAAGTYRVDPERIARAMLDRLA